MPEANTLRGRIIEAIGADHVSGLAGPSGNLLVTRADMDRVKVWQADLNLDPDTILVIVAETMSRKRDGPPSRFTYFDRAMQREAGRRLRPPEPQSIPYLSEPQAVSNELAAKCSGLIKRIPKVEV